MRRKLPAFKAGERVLIGARSGTIAPDAVPREAGLWPIDMDDGTRQVVADYAIEYEDKTVVPSEDRPLKKGDRVTANGEPGVFVEYLSSRPYARVDLDAGGRITVEEAFVKAEKTAKALTQPAPPRSHKMVTGPNTEPKK